jgi:nicotinamidase-related amidase
MTLRLDDRPALVLVDVQQGFEEESWGRRDNPAADANIEALLAAWAAAEAPLVFVRHDSEEDSPLAPGRPGNALKPYMRGEPALLVAKTVNSAFLGTPDLHVWLGGAGIGTVVIAGITTNHCCETTARFAGNLGYRTLFALDATHTFDRTGPDGVVVPAEQLARITAVNLHDEFAEVVSTAELVAARQAGTNTTQSRPARFAS